MTHRETIPKNQAGIGQNDTHEFASSSTESHVPTTVRTTALSDHDASLTRCSQEQEQRSNTCDYVTLPAKIACVRCQKKVNTDVCMSGYLNNEPTERCIFCHDTDGTQYVAVHANSESYKCIPYSESLKGHRACANCWAAWEAKVIKQSGSFTRSWSAGGIAPRVNSKRIPCPVCQRSVDVRQGYTDDMFCSGCLDAVVCKSRPPSPPKPPQSSCSCCSCCNIFVAVAVCGIAIVICEVARRLFLAKVLHVLREVPQADLESAVPPPLRELLCPAMRFISSGMSATNPLEGIVLEFGSRVCGWQPTMGYNNAFGTISQMLLAAFTA